MNVAAGPELAAAVTNAGGMGVIGGVGYTPKILRQQVSLVLPLLPPPLRNHRACGELPQTPDWDRRAFLALP